MERKTYVLIMSPVYLIKDGDVPEKYQVAVEVEDERGSAKARLPKPFDFSPES